MPAHRSLPVSRRPLALAAAVALLVLILVAWILASVLTPDSEARLSSAAGSTSPSATSSPSSPEPASPPPSSAAPPTTSSPAPKSSPSASPPPKASPTPERSSDERASRSRRDSASPSPSASAVTAAWVRPDPGEFTSGFGERWGSMHEGVDLSAGQGTPIKAAADGTVATAECTSPDCSQPGGLGMSGYGNMVDIQHTGGVVTRYGHLLRYVVKVGQKVKAGDVIGYEGSTGNSTGSHLHFEVHVNGEPVDPVPFMSQRGVKLQ